MVKDNFFVRITEPNELRKQVLEGSKTIIQNLKGYQKILAIREKKLAEIRTLKADIKEIKLLMDKLRDLLPHEMLKQFEKKPTHKKKTSKKKGAKKPFARKKIMRPSEVTRLEDALSNIEEKLKGLS